MAHVSPMNSVWDLGSIVLFLSLRYMYSMYSIIMSISLTSPFAAASNFTLRYFRIAIEHEIKGAMYYDEACLLCNKFDSCSSFS